MPNKTESDLLIKANPGQINIDEAKGIVECFVAGIGNKDSVGDIVQPGAFTESLKRRRPRVVWGHNWNDPIGKVLEIYEVGPNDPRLPEKMKRAGIGGLYAKVQFNLGTEKGREAFASVAFFGTDQEWSIGYKTINATFDPARQANILREVELYECSPVLHGANQLTGTISVKSDPSAVYGSIDEMIDALEDDDFWEEKGEPLRDPKGGLTAAGRRHFNRTEGSNLKPGVRGAADTPEKMRRKGSFLTRFFTNPSGPMKKPNGKPTRLALSAAAWGEPVPQDRSDAAALAAKGRRLLERYENAKKKDADYDEFDAEAFWNEFDESDFEIDAKCGMMGHGMPSAVRQRWMEMVRNSQRDEDYGDREEDDDDGDIFEEGLAQMLNDERRNELEMEMNSRSKYPIKIIEATENTVTFKVMKDGQKLIYRMGYHHDKEERRYMFGKPERVQMTFAPIRPAEARPMMAKPNVDPNRQYPARDEDESLMPRVLRIVQKFGDDEKSLLDDETVEFLDRMNVEMKAGRVISSRNMTKLKNVVSLLQEILASAGAIEEKSDEMIIPCAIEDAFATKSLIDPIIEYHGAIAEVTENGIHIKSGATEEFRNAIETATSAFSYKALGGRLGGGGGKGRRAARFATARFDPNAIDGDEDGLVQEGTPFERPATPKPGKLASAVENAGRSRGIIDPTEKPRTVRPSDLKPRSRTMAEMDKWAESFKKDLKKLEDLSVDAPDWWTEPLRGMNVDRPLTMMDALNVQDPTLAARATYAMDGLMERIDLPTSNEERLSRLSTSTPSILDAPYWKIDGDGNPTLRRDDKGNIVPSWLEDPQMNSMLNNEFNEGKPVPMLAKQNGLSRAEVRRAITQDINKQRNVSPKKRDKDGGFASIIGAQKEMVQRDANGKVVYDGSKLLNELAEKREKLLKDLGFDDDQITALLGYRPNQQGFGSRASMRDAQLFKSDPKTNMAELEDLFKRRSDFFKKNKDFDPGKEDWENEEWSSKWEELTELQDEIDFIRDFYDQQGDLMQEAQVRIDDLRTEMDELREELQSDAQLMIDDIGGITDDWRDVLGFAEANDEAAFISRYASGRQEGDVAVGDGVDLVGEESRFRRDRARSTHRTISENLANLDEKHTDLYGAELDLSEATRHGHAAKAVNDMHEAGMRASTPDRANMPTIDRPGFASRAGISEGVGLGRSREIKGRGKSGISRAYYNAADETLTVSWGGDDYTYYGVPDNLIGMLETSPQQGRVMQQIKNAATGFIHNRSDGSFRMEGKAPTPAQRLEKDLKRIDGSVKLSDRERKIYQSAIDMSSNKGLLDPMSADERMKMARDVSDLAANMLARRENGAARRLNKAALDISPHRSSANKIEPMTDKLEISLADDEILDWQRSLTLAKTMLADRLGSSASIKQVSDEIDRLFDKLKKNDNGTIKMSADEYRDIYDALDDGTEFMGGLQRVRYGLDQAALSTKGKYTSSEKPKTSVRAKITRKAPNNGAPADITPRMQGDFIFWGRRQPGFRRVQDLVKKYDERDGQLPTKDWIRLHDYYALHSRAGKGMPLYGQKTRTGFGSSVASTPSSPDAPRKRAPGGGRKMGIDDEKRFRGKTWSEVKPKDWELMSPEQQEEELLTNLKPERTGMRQVDYDRLIRELAERSIEDNESRSDRLRRRREERMAERARVFEGLSEEEIDRRRAEREAREAAVSQSATEAREMTAADAKAVRKKVRSGLDKSIGREGDRMREASDTGQADSMHAEAWDNMMEIMGSGSDLTMSQLDALEEALNEYLDDANSLDELTGAESRSVRNAKALLSKVEDLKEQFSEDKFILQGDTEAVGRVGRGGDEFVDAIERNGFASGINTARVRQYLNVRNDEKVRERGFASSADKAGRTEVKGQATFFKQVKDSLDKEIREAEKNSDRDTAKALRLLDKIMDRQDTAKTGSKRTDAGQLLVTQAELDSILDALMVVVDRQMETGGSEERINAFVKLIDMLAASGMSTFINKTTDEVGSRTQERVNSRGRTVEIPNT